MRSKIGELIIRKSKTSLEEYRINFKSEIIDICISIIKFYFFTIDLAQCRSIFVRFSCTTFKKGLRYHLNLIFWRPGFSPTLKLQ